MRAHFVPISYLRAFSIGNGDRRRSVAYAIARDKVFKAGLDNLCVCSDYYTAFPEQDAALFAAHEPVYATLVQRISAGDTAALDSIANHIWSLKLRNRSILDFSRYRELVMHAGANVDLSSHVARIITVPADTFLITSDDPVLILGTGNPSEMCFILPLTPQLIVVTASTHFFSIHSSTAKAEDVDLLNTLQCKQCRRYAISKHFPPRPDLLQRNIPESPREARSEALLAPSKNRGVLILNFVTHNPKGPGMGLSFLSAR